VEMGAVEDVAEVVGVAEVAEVVVLVEEGSEVLGWLADVLVGVWSWGERCG
jgi:hypothetical protein